MVIVRVDFDRASEGEAGISNLHDLRRRLQTIVEGFRSIRAAPKPNGMGIRFEADYRGGLSAGEIESIGEIIERHAGSAASSTRATCIVTLPESARNRGGGMGAFAGRGP